jgi:hypothetical protein
MILTEFMCNVIYDSLGTVNEKSEISISAHTLIQIFMLEHWFVPVIYRF